MPPRHILLEQERPTLPKPTIVFDLRRHLQPTASKNLEKLYLTAKFQEDKGYSRYPIKIDGATGVISVRKKTIEELGFDLVIEEDR